MRLWRKSGLPRHRRLLTMNTTIADRRTLRPEVTNEVLDEIVRRIVERFDPEKVILFGSYVWGNPDVDSDVDLFVVMESEHDPFERSREVRRAADTPFLPMDVLVRTPSEVQERLAMGDPFISRILQEGLVLYDHRGGVEKHRW